MKIEKRKLTKRSAARWQNIIERKVPQEAHVKVACSVWWDFSTKPNFTTSEWFRERLDEYTTDHEIEKQDLGDHLSAIGYTTPMVNNIVRSKWWDDVKTRADNKEKKCLTK